MGFRRRTLRTEDELYDHAIALLARRMRSIRELEKLLGRSVDSRSEAGRILVELVIRRLGDLGYLNDERFAAAYSEFRRDNDKFGPGRIARDLKAKGLHQEIISRALASTFRDFDEEKQARAYLRRKRSLPPSDRQQAARIFRQLVRAGFQAKTAFGILRKWEVGEDVLGELEDALNLEDQPGEDQPGS